jgi:uncharacterized membrane protein YoaT (DUF817 family)
MEKSVRETRPVHETGPYLEPLRIVIRGGLAHLPWRLSEFILFGLKKAWACLFAAIMLGLMIGTKFVWQADWPVYRYDVLFFAALAIQALFLRFKMESWDEAKVILVYHIVGTLMEIYKVQMGSWAYPEPGLIKLFGVPLFSGFMYASVGSFMARTIRIFDMRFTRYPPKWQTFLLAAAIYVNFYSHHYLPDIRLSAVCGHGHRLLARQRLFHDGSDDSLDAVDARRLPVIDLSLDRRKYRHGDRNMGLSLAASLACRVFLEARVMVSAAFCELRAGDAGAGAETATGEVTSWLIESISACCAASMSAAPTRFP